MTVSPTYPGVYVQEIPSGVRTIAGVRTSVALFVGRAKAGPINVPQLCINYSAFASRFSESNQFGNLPRYVKLFFQNGGTECWVMRIANNAGTAFVNLRNELGADTLVLTAKEAGQIGEDIRAEVTYSGPQPEVTFNLRVFRWLTNPNGRREIQGEEIWQNLSMDPNDPLYAQDVLTQRSALVNATDLMPVAGVTGYSQSGRLVPVDLANMPTFVTAWQNIITATANQFQISVEGNRFVTVDLSAVVITTVAALTAAIQAAVTNAYATVGVVLTNPVNVTLQAGPVPPVAAGTSTQLLRIESGTNDQNVFIRPALANDLAVPLMLGTGQGGIEVGAYAANRPAPSGLTFHVLDAVGAYNPFAGLLQTAANYTIDLERVDPTLPPNAPLGVDTIPVDLNTTNVGDPFYIAESPPVSPNGGMDGVRQKLGLIRDAINSWAELDPRNFHWRSELWGSRLAILPTGAEPRMAENFVSVNFASLPVPSLLPMFTNNTRFYSVGAGGAAAFQTPAPAVASDGGPPTTADYDAAYIVVNQQVDLFNLLILPPDATPAQPMEDLWGPGSVFCQQRRAFLLMDPPANWTDVQTPLTAATANIDQLRIGLVKDYSAIYYPNLFIREAGRRITVGPAGAIAGLMSRIDGTRGVWKAAAGVEADLRGIVGVERKFSDGDNGVLNPRGINLLREFPTGIVAWGARTMDGDDGFASEYKYSNVRRLALFIEESLYRGLKWVVFEGNDEPLWAQIRLNVGAFMQDLFRKQAFAGTTPRSAYFVKCDAETTTPNDQNLGIVNIRVGFAPLKPAEFVILYLQQMTAQAEV